MAFICRPINSRCFFFHFKNDFLAIRLLFRYIIGRLEQFSNTRWPPEYKNMIFCNISILDMKVQMEDVSLHLKIKLFP